MTIHFKISYRTEWGQRLYIEDSLGGEHPLHYMAPEWWCGDVVPSASEFQYRYVLENQDGTKSYEAGGFRSISPARGFSELFVNDAFQGQDGNAPFLTDAFTKVFFRHEVKKLTTRRAEPLVIRVTVPNVKAEEAVAISGSIPALGNWNPLEAPELSHVGGGRWEIHLKNPGKAFEFKFIIKNIDGNVIWENGENRFLEPKDRVESYEYSAAAFTPRHPKIFGTAIPVFSLRTENGCGTGEFLDIAQFAQWAEKTGQNIIQILPINDTTTTKTWTDSYPYGAISVMAFHPLYLNIEATGKLPAADLKEFRKIKSELNALAAVDYEKVMAVKLKYSRILFDKYGAKTESTTSYSQWFAESKDWLLPFCAFSALRDKFKTADFSQWKKYSTYSEGLAEKIYSCNDELGTSAHFYAYLQYHLHCQLKAAVDSAHERGIALKGDIPIGIMPHSVDAWTSPELFNMDSQAGAPPDVFSDDGQNWGFPTYNWERMAEDGYAWWRRRFRQMAKYFDAYRIDHILGFFRIWEIPAESGIALQGHFAPALPYTENDIRHSGVPFGEWMVGDLFVRDPHKEGYYHPRINANRTKTFAALPDYAKPAYMALYNDFFYRRNDSFWKLQALKKLPPLISSTGMLTCGEDLGMIPACVPDVMAALNILSLEVQRMPKNPEDEFGKPWTYPYFSVCTTGSHDTSTLRQWWDEDRGATQRYFNNILHLGGAAPKDLEPWICVKIIRSHVESGAMLTILPWQDWMSIDGTLRAQDPSVERINIPANPKHYWRYRMHLGIEQLLEQEDFNNRLKEITE